MWGRKSKKALAHEPEMCSVFISAKVKGLHAEVTATCTCGRFVATATSPSHGTIVFDVASHVRGTSVQELHLLLGKDITNLIHAAAAKDAQAEPGEDKHIWYALGSVNVGRKQVTLLECPCGMTRPDWERT